MKKRSEMTFDEFLDWQTGAILTALIKGELRGGVCSALLQFDMWQKEKVEQEKKAKKK